MNDPLLRPGTNHCLCCACGEYFSTPANFDMHRKDGACRNPAEILFEKGSRKGLPKLQKAENGLWKGATAGCGFPQEFPSGKDNE